MFGTTTPPTRIGNPTRLSADGYAVDLDSGVTIAWELIAPITTAVTLPDGTYYAVGAQYIPLGTVLVPVTSTGGGTAGSAVGKWAPYDSSKTDGRQTLKVGDCALMDYHIQKWIPGIYNMVQETDLMGLIVGGLVFRARLKAGGTNQPTLDQIRAAFPQLRFTRPENGTY